MTCIPDKGELHMLLASREHTFTFALSQESSGAPRLLMESRAALVTAVATRVVLTFTAGFLVNKGGNMLSAAFGTKNERFSMKGRMKRRENFHTEDQNITVLSVWEGRGARVRSRYWMGTRFRRPRPVLGSLGFSLEESRGPIGSNLGPKTKIPFL